MTVRFWRFSLQRNSQHSRHPRKHPTRSSSRRRCQRCKRCRPQGLSGKSSWASMRRYMSRRPEGGVNAIAGVASSRVFNRNVTNVANAVARNAFNAQNLGRSLSTLLATIALEVASEMTHSGRSHPGTAEARRGTSVTLATGTVSQTCCTLRIGIRPLTRRSSRSLACQNGCMWSMTRGRSVR
jgi:hypothetical protein